MTDGTPTPPPPGRAGKIAAGCGLVALLAIALPAGGWWLWSRHQDELARAAAEAQTAKAKSESEPALESLSRAAAANQTYDIDKTVRVIHEIDLGMKSQASMKDYLAYLATQDYRGVAPEVLEARRKLLEIQARLYSKQTEAEDQQAAWEFSRDLALQMASVVQVEGGVATGNFSVDSTRARKLLDDLAAKEAEKKRLQHDIQALQDELFAGMLDYSTVYYKYIDEWDRLCVQRDRAYLGVANGDWGTVRDSARAAVATAPDEKEAHLLLALALIEGKEPESYGEAGRILDAYIHEHPDATAPAFLLRGVLEERLGNLAAANLDFQQSAAYYPKQAATLTEMLDPYKMRDYLRKSREGNYILDIYQASMLGAGYFSPDLQLAKVAFAQGDRTSGKQKIMDHFARRRSQGEWNFLLQDIQYAQDLLGNDFQELFPENSYLDLVVKPTMFGDKLSVGVNNRSSRALHNATLILVIHFTDTHPGDYEPFAAEKTQPAVLPHETTDFGEMSVQTELWGKPKSVGDIVEDRAILLTDEAVMWVDTDEHKIAEAKEFRDAAKRADSRPNAWQDQMRGRLAETTASLQRDVSVNVETKYGFDDDLVIQVPATLAVFKPVFTLEYGGQTLKADTDTIDADHIVLRFKGVANFEGKTPAAAQAMRLIMDSVFGRVVMNWMPGEGASWTFAGARAQ